MVDCWARIGLTHGGHDGNQAAVAAAVPELSNSPRNRQGTRGFSMGGLFRGVRAPASLKQVAHRGARCAAPWRTLPGRTRPGLIEACRSWPGRCRARRSLPGRTRPGLIEAGSAPRPPAVPRTLPGRTRPGLIEARSTRRRSISTALPLPGRTRPGLIEATPRYSAGFLSAPSSGASSPRALGSTLESGLRGGALAALELVRHFGRRALPSFRR